MKSLFTNLVELAKVVIVATAIVVPIRYFLFQPFFVKGPSMEPNFQSGDYLIVDEISYRFREPSRGEVVVFKYPQNLQLRFIKRIIGLPGETVEIKENKVTVYRDSQSITLNESIYIPSHEKTLGNAMIILKENEYFVMGDNRDSSYDSRQFGSLAKDFIIGRAALKAWPLASLSSIKTPTY